MKYFLKIWIFHALSFKILFSEMPINPFLMAVMLLNLSSVQFWTFNAISNVMFKTDVSKVQC